MKRAALQISPLMFINLIDDFKKGRTIRVLESDIPDDAKFITAYYDDLSQCMYLVLESEEFEDIEEGQRYPILDKIVVRTYDNSFCNDQPEIFKEPCPHCGRKDCHWLMHG